MIHRLLSLIGISSVIARLDTLSPTDYLTLSVECKDTRIKIVTQTLDPFSGVLYVQPSNSIRRGHQGPSHCRIEGRGRHEVSLEVGLGQCGWKRDGSHVTLNVYMQYDPHVQQVIDEQMMVECDMASRTGKVVDMGVLDTVRNVANIPISAIQSFGQGSSWITDEDVEEDLLIEDTDEKMADTELNKLSEIAANDRFDGSRERRLNDETPVSGWLDISQEGGQIKDPLEEGEVVRLSAKVKQTQLKDTVLTRCMLATETGKLLELTDEYGCSLDDNIVTNFHSIINEITEVKETIAQFTVPTIAIGKKIESVKIRCNLLVCQENCPIIKCNRDNPPISVQDSIVLETQALFAKKQVMNVADEVNHEIKSLLGAEEHESQLCLSPTRLVLAFGVLIIVIIASLLLSCYLWMKARKRILPRPPMPIQRVPYIMPNRARPYIRVLT